MLSQNVKRTIVRNSRRLGTLRAISRARPTPLARTFSTCNRLLDESTKAPEVPAASEGIPLGESGGLPSELQSTDLLDVYNSLVARGLIVWDAEQVRCVMEVSSRCNN
jgi:hypothetical protein